uniref:Uncharacterized protein n=1 Tax=Meloidogyne hapla TaxID=6305 RepID=A0A1I8B0C1_MELHA
MDDFIPTTSNNITNISPNNYSPHRQRRLQWISFNLKNKNLNNQQSDASTFEQSFFNSQQNSTFNYSQQNVESFDKVELIKEKLKNEKRINLIKNNDEKKGKYNKNKMLVSAK